LKYAGTSGASGLTYLLIYLLHAITISIERGQVLLSDR